VPVYYHSEEISFYFPEQDLSTMWIKAVLSSHKAVCGTINIVFTSNAYLLKINQEYLKHNYFTDVITFDLSEENLISGDVFISVDQVRINSQELNVTFYNELNRVMIHGILHMLGFKDHFLEEKTEMRRMEDKALKILEEMQNERRL
jgi:probable rRNA maturation factor